MNGLLKYNYEEPDATGVAHDNIDSILAENRYNTQQETYAREGTIGPTPFIDTEEGQDLLLSLVTGSPGSAIGRISKGAITGGQSLLASKPQELINQILKTKGGAGLTQQVEYNNVINRARILMEKALDKFGIKHSQAVNDPITEILRAGKHRRN